MQLNYKNYIRQFLLERSDKFLPQWLVLIKDVFIVCFSFVIAYTLRYNFQLNNEIRSDMYHQLVYIILFVTTAFLFTGLYKTIIRHTGVRDAILVMKAMSFVVAALLIINTLNNFYVHYWLSHIPYSIIIIFYVIAIALLVTTRFAIRLIYYWMKSQGDFVNVLIYGAGSAGIITKNVLQADLDRRVKVVGFVDNHPGKIGKTIEGVFVYSAGVLNPKFLSEKGVKEVIFAIQKIEKDQKRELIEELLLQTQLEVKEIPPVAHWINGQLSVKQISRVKIEDLLQRSEIRLDNEHMREQLTGRRVMVTGAAGSIGSEMVRQLCQLDVQQLIMVDQAETPMFDLENELKERFPEMVVKFEFIIANVGDKSMMEQVFAEFTPEVIYHAAAYKHVPMMEQNPYEAVRVNVFGTKVMADLASRFRAERFVMISTDKAVNPTNVMGATKRAAEIYIQSLNHDFTNKTRFITTRFGNVLGSNGSVIPIFEKQIAAGGPVKVTHPEITRYFMTIPEACQLVLEAGALGNGGEILMFDMGKPVRIADLAFNMIRLSGLEPDKDIKIVYTGLRPGEKLYEELLYDKEKGIPTHHPKISIAKVRYNRLADVVETLADLSHSMELNDKMVLVAALKKMVPEFKSNNSVYQVLDKVG
ncbi:MAG TPA: nucleoside-diphosphate sugar epimerase/dehydratase [Bacteroidales bacterium]|nr:nucleoside-diphosphate sugar epimerase/dehydratase [Bacteroidales bacterium]